MAEDQSVVGKRRIYYDPHGSEALICSDSEEEITEPDEEKHEFSEGEDRILRWVLMEIIFTQKNCELVFISVLYRSVVGDNGVGLVWFLFFLSRQGGMKPPLPYFANLLSL